ncbi:hypothetical protein LR010_00740 [Candidatus Gracilibacteria bacterium]|nr:hypothetical protein [Candidatus Gracilibacteria bacterium]
MKKILATAMLFVVTAVGVFAESKNGYVERYKDVEYYDFDFNVEISEQGVAKASWNSYPKGKGFMYYKLMYSTKYANPVYPDLGAKYVGVNITDLGNSFHLESGDTHYFRLCTITDEDYGVKGRYCSSTRKEEVESNGKTYEKKENSYVSSNSNISSELQNKVEERITSFIQSLKDKGYSDDKIVTVIDSVLTRLEKYKEDTRYTAIVTYMQKLLEEYRSEYKDELDIFDDIFGEY